MVTDPIADLLTRIRNAAYAGHPTVSVPASRKKERLLAVLKDEGFIDRIDRTEIDGKPQLKIFLRYDQAGTAVIRRLDRLSRPGRRIYVNRDEIPTVRNGLGMVVISTSKGMLSDREARRQGVGGELICSVF